MFQELWFRGERYGLAHWTLRVSVARDVEAGGVLCSRCGFEIVPGTPWDLGHDDLNPDAYTGPEHRRCNRATAGRRRAYSRRW